MKIQRTIKTVLLSFLILGFISCKENVLSTSDFTGVYNAKKIGSQQTFPLTIFTALEDQISIEAQWLNSGFQVVTATIDDNRFTFDQDFSDQNVSGSGFIEGDTITINYLLSGNSRKIVASK